MSLLRTCRQAGLLRSLAPRATATAPLVSPSGRRFAHEGYGAGETKSDQAANQTQRDAEHPGPAQPKAAQQGNGQQQTGQSNRGGEQKSNSSSKAQPKILSENPPAQGEESEDVAKHNREFAQRHDRAEEGVKNEEAEKDKVPKDYWSGRLHGG